MRTDEVRQARRVQLCNGGGDGGFLLVAERSVFPGVWIESADGDSWFSDSLFSEKPGGEFPYGDDRILRE